MGSLLPADTDPDWFLRQLGIQKKQTAIGDEYWTLVGKNLDFIESDGNGREFIVITIDFLKALRKENDRRVKSRGIIQKLVSADPLIRSDEVILRWDNESRQIAEDVIELGTNIQVITVTADPAHINERIAFASSAKVKSILGSEIRWDQE